MDFTNFTLDRLLSFLSVDTLRTLGALIALPIVYFTVECFFGFRFFHIKCAVVGFSAGASAGLLLATALDASKGVHIGLCVVLGLLFAFLSYKVYKFGVFFIIAITAFPIGLNLGGTTAGIILAIVVGIAAVLLTKPMIIASSAFSGGTGLAACIFTLLNYTNDTLLFLLGLLLCAAGAVAQAKMSVHI